MRKRCSWSEQRRSLLLLLGADSHTQDDFLCEAPFTSFSHGFSLYYRDKQHPTEPCDKRGYVCAIFVRASICLHVRVLMCLCVSKKHGRVGCYAFSHVLPLVCSHETSQWSRVELMGEQFICNASTV